MHPGEAELYSGGFIELAGKAAIYKIGVHMRHFVPHHGACIE